MRKMVTIVFFMCLLSAPAMAQVTTTLNPSETYFPVIQFTNPTFGQCLGSTISGSGAWCFALNPSNTTLPTGVPISLFATKEEVNAAAANTQANLTAFSDKTDLNINKLFSLVAYPRHFRTPFRTLEIVLPFRLNAAGFRGNLAGAIGASANVGRIARFSFNYGQAKSEHIFSGGLNISIH
jgi:hypothetical protein